MAKKSNIKEFKEKIKNITNSEYSLIGEYFNSRTKVEILHKKCGYKHEVTPNAFLRGSRCPRCSGKMKKNTEIFKKEVFDLVGDEYEVLGEYVYCSTKIRMKHNKCRYEYKVKPIVFLRGVRCSKCAGVLKKTTGQFKKEVSNLVGDEYEVLGEYINANTKIRMKHNKCGCEYEVIPNAFLRGNRCPKCSGKMKKNTKIFKQEVFDLVGNEYIVLGEYITTDTKIKMKHNKCGCEYEVAPATFLHNHRCPNCFGKMKKTTGQFKKEVSNLVGDSRRSSNQDYGTGRGF